MFSITLRIVLIMSDSKYEFYVSGISCVSCAQSITAVLKENLQEKGSVILKNLHVDYAGEPKKVTIRLENLSTKLHPDIEQLLVCWITEAGYNCSPIVSKKTNKLKSFFKSNWFQGGVGSILGTGVLICCTLLPVLPFSAMIAIGILSTIATLGLGLRSYIEAWRKLYRSRTLTMDSLYALSTLTILGVSIASFFIPWLPMMFDAALLIYGFKHLGAAIENSIKKKLYSGTLQNLAPQKIRLAESEELTEVSTLQENDVIKILPGETVPVDGLSMNEAILYDTIISGSSFSRTYLKEKQILAGTRVAEKSAPLVLRVTHSEKNSYLARLDQRIIAAEAVTKAPIEIKTTKILNYFIPGLILLAVLAGVGIGAFFSLTLGIQAAAYILVSACPCTLGLITPLAVKTGMQKAAKLGVQFHNAAALQEAEQISTLVFDLNGTLTTGNPEVQRYTLISKNSSTSILGIYAALEQETDHGIGSSIFKFITKKGAPSYTLTGVNSTTHGGISGCFGKQRYHIGNSAYMKKESILWPENIPQMTVAPYEQIIYMACDHELIGYFVLTDPLQHDAKDTINFLKAKGKEIHLCTGADPETANRYAQELGIDIVHANQTPEAKSAYIQTLMANNHRVAMFGDALNDSLAITQADYGVALESPLTHVRVHEKAKASIKNGSLAPVASLFRISEQTIHNIKQNLHWSLAYNLGSMAITGILIGFGVALNPGVGVAIMIIQACIVLLNVYRFKNQPLPSITSDKITQPPNIHEDIEGKQLVNTPSPHHAPLFSAKPVQKVIQKQVLTGQWHEQEGDRVPSPHC
ncbi:MAG: cation-translocating P-type ATPase [Legionella sp.]|nr:cation-translocating P-type ATPase [Legionella sp.]